MTKFFVFVFEFRPKYHGGKWLSLVGVPKQITSNQWVLRFPCAGKYENEEGVSNGGFSAGWKEVVRLAESKTSSLSSGIDFPSEHAIQEGEV